MGQVLGLENIPNIVIASNTSLTLATTAVGKPTRIIVGGQQYVPSSTITLNTGTSGFNGIDTGSIAANTLYYIYAVVNGSGTLGMVLSTSSSAPTGFSAYQNIGRCRTFVGTTNLAAVCNWKDGRSMSESAAMQSYSVSVSNFTSGNGSLAGQYGRNGNNMEVFIFFGSGTTSTYTSTDWTFGLPGSLSIENASAFGGLLGEATGRFNDGSNGEHRSGFVFFASAGSVMVRIAPNNDGYSNTAWNSTSTGVGNNLVGTSMYLHFNAPIGEWKNVFID